MQTVHRLTSVATHTAISKHHRWLRDRVTELTSDLVDAVCAKQPHWPAQGRLLAFLREELLPHAKVEQQVLYDAGLSAGTALLCASLSVDHRMLTVLVTELEDADTGPEVAALAGGLVSLFFTRLEKEDTLLLPALAADGVDLAGLVADREELLGDQAV